jgi:hypothetical protein
MNSGSHTLGPPTRGRHTKYVCYDLSKLFLRGPLVDMTDDG